MIGHCGFVPIFVLNWYPSNGESMFKKIMILSEFSESNIQQIVNFNGTRFTSKSVKIV